MSSSRSQQKLSTRKHLSTASRRRTNSERAASTTNAASGSNKRHRSSFSTPTNHHSAVKISPALVRSFSTSKLKAPKLQQAAKLTEGDSKRASAGEAASAAPKPAVAPSKAFGKIDSEKSEKERQRVLALLEPEDDPNRLVREYPFKAKSLQFRTNYDHLLAKSYVWVPRTPDTFHEMLGVISQAVAFLGFDEASINSSHQAQYTTIQCTAELSENGLDLEDSRLSLLWIRPPEYAWNQLRNFVVYRQVDSQHEGIINKWLLIANLQNTDHRMRFKTADGIRFTSKYFLPQTINLDMPMDELISLLGASDGTYIVKEVRGTKGKNITLLRLGRSRANGHRDLLEMLKGSGLLKHRLSDVILQKYIDKPLLVDKRKFDFRVYMLMVNACRKEKSGSRSKAFYVYWHPGFLRLCIMAYQRDSADLLCHLTNQHIQMSSVLYDQFKEATVWEPDELNNYFNTKGGLPAKDYVRDIIYPKIGTIVGYLGATFAESLNDNTIQASTFKVFGIDFMVDSRLSVQLLEVNELPSWRRQTRVLARLKADLWREAVALTVETVAKFQQHQQLDPLVSQCNFRLAHSSEDPALLGNAIAKYFH